MKRLICKLFGCKWKCTMDFNYCGPNIQWYDCERCNNHKKIKDGVII